MSNFEVTTNLKCPILGKLRVRSKSVSFANAPDLTKRFNMSRKWEVEKQLMDDISSSRGLYKESSELQELHFIFQRIANQISATESLISHKTTEILIGILVDRISSLLAPIQQKEKHSEKKDVLHTGIFVSVDEFSCRNCFELLCHPVTLSCGHSFCQLCILQNQMKTCIVCTKPLERENYINYRVNNILNKMLQKWHSVESNGRALVEGGLKKFYEKSYKEAANQFSQALEITPNSHIATLYRAKARYLLNQFDLALEDAIRANVLAYKWPEAYFVKGEVFFKLDCFEESLLSLLICLVLDPQHAPAKQRIHEIIKKLVSFACKDTNNPIKISHPTSPRFQLLSHKRLFSGSGCGLFSKKKPSEDDKDNSTAYDALCPSFPLRESKSTPDINDNLVAIKQSSEAMASCTTRTLLTFELSYNKGHNEMPFTDGLGTFPSIASELESALDSVLLQIDDLSTGDLRMLQSSVLDKQIMELVNIEPVRKSRVVDSKLVDSTDFECSLCMRLYYDPVCTPCGHVFCQLCIERSLDHSLMCPLCKHPMQRYLADNLEKQHPTCDYTTKIIMREYMAESCQERLQQHKDEMKELRNKDPIFVCTIAFPSVPCPLHIFEPRYRLMLRRCLDHNAREFGMCKPERGKAHHTIGTLLKIRDVRFFPDGRSVIDSIGSRRFKTSDCEHKDGYNVAKITYIVDQPVANPEALDKTMNKVYAEAKAWFGSLQEKVKDQVINHFGNFPIKDSDVSGENGPDWVWWVLAILPVEDDVKANILGKDALYQRLLIMHRIFTCLQQRKQL